MKTTLHHTKRLFLVPVLFAAAVASDGAARPAVASGDAPEPWTVVGNIPLDKFAIQLHRSAGEYLPENTLESCEYAWELGTIPEVDLRTTSDGVIVAFHDTHFNRVVEDPDPKLSGRGVVDFTFEELQEIDVGAFRGEAYAGQRIPRIEDIFAAMRDRPEREIYLDIKVADLEKLAEMVKTAGVSRQVIFTTTHHNFIREWKALVPDSQSLNWIGGSEERIRERLEALREAEFDGITQLQVHVRLNPDESSPEPFNLSRGFIRDLGAELRARGILFQALPWRLSEPEIFWALLDLGVASFATDFPEETVQAVRDYYSGRR